MRAPPQQAARPPRTPLRRARHWLSCWLLACLAWALSAAPAAAQGDVFASQGRRAPAGDVFSSNGNPYGGPYPSRPTGKQAYQDDSVYCQQDPFGRVIPKPYGGTRRNIPCGPNFAPQQAQPVPQRPPPIADTSCPRWRGAFNGAQEPTPTLAAGGLIDLVARPQDAAQWHATQSGGTDSGLYINGRPILTASDAGLAPFTPAETEVFHAMRCHWKRRFEFASGQELLTNLRVRVAIVAVMNEVRNKTIRMLWRSGGFHVPSGGWYEATDNTAGSMTNARGQTLSWASNARMPAWDAMQYLFVKVRPEDPPNTYYWVVDCLSGMQLVVLGGVSRALAPAEFNRQHPSGGGSALYGIGVPLLQQGQPTRSDASSVLQHLSVVRTITDGPSDIQVRDMVPGDYVYLSNASDYSTYQKYGGLAGENAIYMGNGLLYGLGMGPDLVTESDIKRTLWQDYVDHLPAERTQSRIKVDRSSQVRFTLLAAPMVSRNPGNAGRYVR